MNTTLRLIPLLLLLAGCSMSNEQLISACKTDDWVAIGQNDGTKGEPPSFGERKEFCDDHGNKAGAADASARYTAGWAQGNWDLWYRFGGVDGTEGKLARFDALAASEDLRKKYRQLTEIAKSLR